MSETNRIEYKRELTPELDIEKEVVAFLNYKEGGYIYIGIDKDGSTVDVNDMDDCMLRLKDRINHNISPSAMGLFDSLVLDTFKIKFTHKKNCVSKVNNIFLC